MANGANGDVLGHTANQSAKVRAAAAVDAHLGKIVELLSTEELISGEALHPYTQVLLAAVPQVFASGSWEYASLPKNVADPARPPAGCSFHPRCPVAVAMCSQVEPDLLQVNDGHLCACHLVSGAE